MLNLICTSVFLAALILVPIYIIGESFRFWYNDPYWRNRCHRGGKQ
jgi:hypothetical protein